jgi:hypothetical protein
VLADFAVLEPVDSDGRERHSFAGCWHAHEADFVGGSSDHLRDDAISFGDLLQDFDMGINALQCFEKPSVIGVKHLEAGVVFAGHGMVDAVGVPVVWECSQVLLVPNGFD